MNLRKRFLSLLLALIVLVPTLVIPAMPTASASVESNIGRLTEWQKDFLRVIRSLALKDAYDTGVLASITAGQALYEGGWARYGISVIANNQYGIKAYSNWDGKVFDNKTYMLYDSYEDLVRIKGSTYARNGSIWRAYDSWEESVADHSALFYAEKKYEKVLAATTYQEAAYEIIAAGYASNWDYVDKLIDIIEDYGLDELDEVTADVNGVVGMMMSQAKAVVAEGGTLELTATAYPDPVIYVPQTEEASTEESSAETSDEISEETAADTSEETSSETSDVISEETSSEESSEEPLPEPVPFEIVWESNAPSVATVDQNGVVTAHSQGIALITATYNGKEAACLVCVGTNAFVLDSDVSVRSEADPESDSLGKIYRGMPVVVLGNRAYTAPDGTNYYEVRGTSSTGKLLTGYVVADRIYLTTRQVSIINAKTELHLDAGTTYQVDVEVAPADAEDKTLTWTSSDEAIATVDQNGLITTHAPGTATVRITAASGISLDISVTVGGTVTYEGITTANLNVRVSPDMDAKSLGLIAEGTIIILHGEPVDGWYYVEAEVIGGEKVKGYSYATYIELLTEDPPDDPADPPAITPPDDPDLPSDPVVLQREGVVSVDEGSSLNIRSSPGTGGERLVKVENGTPLLIVGEDIILEDEKTYKVWYCVQINLDDTFYEGYAAADFITVTKEPDPPAVTPPDDPDDPGTQPDEYVVTDEYVLQVSPGTTYTQFRIKLGANVMVIGKDGERLYGTDVVCSGDTVQYVIGSTVIRTKTLVVRGDVDCDGKVTARDYIMVKRHVLGTFSLEGVGYLSALLSGGEDVTARDYIMIKRNVLGTYTL